MIDGEHYYPGDDDGDDDCDERFAPIVVAVADAIADLNTFIYVFYLNS